MTEPGGATADRVGGHDAADPRAAASSVEGADQALPGPRWDCSGRSSNVQAVDGRELSRSPPGENPRPGRRVGPAARRPPDACSSGCWNPPAGKIIFEGQDITPPAAVGRWRTLRQDMQIIFQDPFSSLNPRHTVGPDRGHADGRERDQAARRGEEAGAGTARESSGSIRSTTTATPHEFSGRATPAHRHRPLARASSPS